MLLPALFVLARDLLDFRLFGGMNHLGGLDALCRGLHCASHRPLLRRNRGFQRDIPHCHIFSDVIDIAPDPTPLRRGLALQLAPSAAWTCCSPPASRVQKVPAAQSHSISVALKLRR